MYTNLGPQKPSSVLPTKANTAEIDFEKFCAHKKDEKLPSQCGVIFLLSGYKLLFICSYCGEQFINNTVDYISHMQTSHIKNKKRKQAHVACTNNKVKNIPTQEEEQDPLGFSVAEDESLICAPDLMAINGIQEGNIQKVQQNQTANFTQKSSPKLPTADNSCSTCAKCGKIFSSALELGNHFKLVHSEAIKTNNSITESELKKRDNSEKEAELIKTQVVDDDREDDIMTDAELEEYLDDVDEQIEAESNDNEYEMELETEFLENVSYDDESEPEMETEFLENSDKKKKYDDSVEKGYEFQKSINTYINIDEIIEKTTEMLDADGICKICRTSFPTLHQLAEHNHEHTGENAYKCDKCEYSSNKQRSFRLHYVRHDESLKRFKCKCCDKKCHTRREIETHVARSHTQIKTHKCELCEKAFICAEGLRSHKATWHDTNKTPCVCELCNVTFASNKNRNLHIKRVHSNAEKEFGCEICDKRFFTRNEMNTHMNFHNGIRPFVCDECGYAFNQMSALRTHKLRHANIRNFKCDQCGNAFVCSQSLKNHKLTHSGERKHCCDFCDARFSRRNALVQHMKVHFDEKDYQCEICGREFSQYAGIHWHMKSVHHTTYRGSKRNNSVNPVFQK